MLASVILVALALMLPVSAMAGPAAVSLAMPVVVAALVSAIPAVRFRSLLHPASAAARVKVAPGTACVHSLLPIVPPTYARDAIPETSRLGRLPPAGGDTDHLRGL